MSSKGPITEPPTVKVKFARQTFEYTGDKAQAALVTWAFYSFAITALLVIGAVFGSRELAGPLISRLLG